MGNKRIQADRSATECATFFNVTSACIGQTCKYNRKTKLGFKFSYKEL